jgi:Na+/melibiose symporter-like transporter
LQPSSRILAASLLLTTVLTTYLPDPEHAEAWKIWAVALGILVPVAPYEVYCIFPINDRVKEIGESLEKGREEKGMKKELEELFGKWIFRNYGRVGIPVVAGVVGWLGVVRR